ncbi:MAG: hypothetical protein IPP90_00185 [Gemmatimonadaceae bacterium]|nr:hypothetical protein [Gemmatimonadaceae bacterium]
MRWRLAAVAALAVPVCTLAAQSARPDSTRRLPVSSRGRLPVTGCAGQRISDVVIITQPPYAERLPERLEFLRKTARAVHSNTRDDVVRGYLLLRPGDVCNQIRRAESERILRAQPFLVDARILVFDDENGGVRLEVETRDEFSLIFEPALTTVAPVLRAVRLGESNIAGTARLMSLEWRDGLAYHDVLGVRFTDYQFGGGRNELRAYGIRHPRGQEMRVDFVRPYYTDLQRFAFLASVDGHRDYANFRRPTGPGNSVNVTRQSAVVGGIKRIGSIRRLQLAGFSLTHSREAIDSATVVIEKAGFQPDIGAPLGVSFRRQNVARANALYGVRLLRFAPAQGFDALTGTQDLRIGLQLGTVYGQGIPIGAARDRDRFMAAGLYAGVGGAKSFLGTQLLGEARNDQGTRSWDNHIVSGRMAWYFRPAIRQLTVVSAEWSMGRDMRTPFQLSFGDRLGGLLGHHDSRSAGAQRLVLRAEQRLVIPSRLNVADIGVAGFAEAGRLWGEHSVPYSSTTPVRGSVGISLLAAVPPRSRRLWRFDFALPVGSDPRKRFELRVTNEDRTRTFWREPSDVAAARERTVPASLFTWP